MADPVLAAGLAAEIARRVDPGDTAEAVGSGELPVLGTPRLLGWMEAATCAVLAGRLAAGQTSVGTRVLLEHLKASPVSSEVRVRAELRHVDGRLLRFEVVASHGDGVIVGRAEITRIVVDAERFMGRV